MRRLALPLLLILLTSPLSARAADPYTEGMRAFAAGRYEEAVTHFTQALERRPDFPPYLYHLAMSHLRAGHKEQAVEVFRRLLDQEGVDELLRRKAYTNLLRALNDLNAFDEIERIARSKDPLVREDAEILNQIGRARLNRGAYQEAVEVLVKATQRDPNNWTIYNNLGLAYLNLGNLKAARLAFERAAELNPRVPFVHNNLGVVYERLGLYDRAEAAFRRALELDPNYRKARISLKRVRRARAATKQRSYVIEGKPTRRR